MVIKMSKYSLGIAYFTVFLIKQDVVIDELSVRVFMRKHGKKITKNAGDFLLIPHFFWNN